MKDADIRFYITHRGKRKQTDVFGKSVGTLYTKEISACYEGEPHLTVTVKGRQVICEDGTVVHDQGTHAQAVAAAKRYLTEQIKSRE